MILCILPLYQVAAAEATEISAVRVATRNDANIPFVRTVLDVNNKVTPKLFVDKSGQYVTVTLPGTKVAADLQTDYKADENIVSKITLAKRLNDTDINFRLPYKVTTDDIKVLPSDRREVRRAASSSILTISRARSGSGTNGNT